MTEFLFYLLSTLLISSSLAVIFSRNPVHSVLFLIFAFFNVAGLFVLMGVEFLAMLLVIVYVGAVAVLFLFIVMMMNISSEDQRPVFSMKRFWNALETMGYFFVYALVFCGIFLPLLLVPPLNDAMMHHDGISLDGALALLATSPWWVFSAASSVPVKILFGLIAFAVARFVAQRSLQKTFIEIVSGFVDSLTFMVLLGLGFVTTFVAMGLGWISSPLRENTAGSPMPPHDLVTNTHALGELMYTDYLFAFQGCGIILLIAMIGAIVLTHRKREGVKKQDVLTQVMRQPKDTLVVQSVPLGQGVE